MESERRLEPEDLLYESGHQVGLGAQLLLELGTLGQDARRLADEARRRLASRPKQDH